jgi:hypothetical protein
MRGVSRAARGWRRNPPSYTPGQPEALQPTFPATRAQPSRNRHASQPQALRATTHSPKPDNYGNSDHLNSDPVQEIKGLRDIIKFQQRFLHSVEPPATKVDIKDVAHAVTRAVEDSTNAVLSVR